MPGTFYLIDYENVHDGGLAGIENLCEEDCVYLFFTENANKLALDCLADIRVPFVVKKVFSGKQSLDMHLVSFLGYLIGCEPPEGRKYTVISHDSDFDGVCQFWCTQIGDPCKVTRQYTIAGWQDEYTDSIDPPNDNKWVDPNLLEQLGDLIQRTIHRNGQINRNNTHSILLSQLCTVLNGSSAYQECRRQSGLKAQHMLEKYFASIITIQTKDSSIWVYDTPNIYLVNKQRAEEMKNPEKQEIAPDVSTQSNPFSLTISTECENQDISDEVFNLDSVPELVCNDLESVLEDSTSLVIEDTPELDLSVEEMLTVDTAGEPDDRAVRIGIIADCMIAHGIDQSDVNELADWIAMLIGDGTGKRAIYHAVLTRFGLKQGLLIYAKIRESLEHTELPGGNCFLKK